MLVVTVPLAIEELEIDEHVGYVHFAVGPLVVCDCLLARLTAHCICDVVENSTKVVEAGIVHLL